MNTLNKRLFGSKEGLLGTLFLAFVLVVVLPLTFDIFRLNLIGKYLTYAFVAVGLVLLWGNAGVLSLGQGVFFGLGGYCMAMFLKLEASDPITTKIQSTPGIPDFMDWNQLTALPAFWVPFKSFPFATLAILVVPAIIAYILGAAMFKRRVGGVYFAVITQALALILSLGIDGNQGYTGGRNGITDLKTLLGWDIRTKSGQYTLYFLSVALLIGVIMLSRWVLSSKMGRILNAMSEKEDRVRFSGYDVSNFKIFIFALAAAISGIGGAMFVLQVGFISPSLVGIVPSIEMVIFAAVGGKRSLLGAVYGTLLVNAGKSLFSETFPQLWLYAMGGLFIVVVMLMPNGLAGIWADYVKPWFAGAKKRLMQPPPVEKTEPAPTTPTTPSASASPKTT